MLKVCQFIFHVSEVGGREKVMAYIHQVLGGKMITVYKERRLEFPIEEESSLEEKKLVKSLQVLDPPLIEKGF